MVTQTALAKLNGHKTKPKVVGLEKAIGVCVWGGGGIRESKGLGDAGA